MCGYVGKWVHGCVSWWVVYREYVCRWVGVQPGCLKVFNVNLGDLQYLENIQVLPVLKNLHITYLRCGFI